MCTLLSVYGGKKEQQRNVRFHTICCQARRCCSRMGARLIYEAPSVQNLSLRARTPSHYGSVWNEPGLAYPRVLY